MHTIEATKKSYDAACKEVLADRYILANILKECVEEFSGESIDYIATVCIQGSPEIGTIPVRADESVRLQLEGLNTEDTSLTEAVVHYSLSCHSSTGRKINQTHHQCGGAEQFFSGLLSAETSHVLLLPLGLSTVWYGVHTLFVR